MKKNRSGENRASPCFFNSRRTNQTLRATIEKLENDEKQLLSSPANALKLLAMEVLLDGKHEEGLTFINCALSLDSTIFNTEEYLKVNSADTYEAHEINDSLPNITVISTQPIEVLRKKHWESYYKTLAARQLSKKNFLCAFRAIEHALRIDSTVLDVGYQLHIPEKLDYFIYQEDSDEKISDLKIKLKLIITEPPIFLSPFHTLIFNRNDIDILSNHALKQALIPKNFVVYSNYEVFDSRDSGYATLFYSNSPLDASVIFGYHNLFIWLLKKATYQKIYEQGLYDVLIFAAAYGHVKIIDILFSRSIIPIPSEDNGLYCFSRIQEIYGERLKRLCDYCCLALIAAAKNNQSETLKKLLDAGYSVDFRNAIGTTALIMASSMGLLEVVNILISYKASVDIINENGESALNLAVLNNHSAVVNRLLSSGASLNLYFGFKKNSSCLFNQLERYRDNYSVIGFIEASFAGREEVRFQLDRIGKVILCKCFDCISVVLAVHDQYNLQKFLSILLNSSSHNGMTALKAAAKSGNIELVRMLVSSGADVNLSPNAYDDKTALMVASEEGFISVVKELVENCGALTEITDRQGWTALFYAVWRENIDVVKVLLVSRASIDSCCRRGWTLLHLACWLGNAEILKILLSSEAKVNSRTHNGWTPLMIACFSGHNEIVKLLLAAGANVDITVNYVPESRKPCSDQVSFLTSFKLTSLIENEVHRGSDETFFKSEMKEGLVCSCEVCAKIDTKRLSNILFYSNDFERLISLKESRSTLTALKIAAKYDHHEIVRILVEGGATVDLQPDGFDRRTALMVAAESGSTLSIKELLDKGRASLETVDDQGWTPLLIASWKGNLESVKTLLSEKASVGAVDLSGWTALMLSAIKGHFEVYYILVEKTDNLNHENQRGLTALMIAACVGSSSIVADLITRKNCIFTKKHRSILSEINRSGLLRIHEVMRFYYFSGPCVIFRVVDDESICLIHPNIRMATEYKEWLSSNGFDCKVEKKGSKEIAFNVVEISKEVYEILQSNYDEITIIDFANRESLAGLLQSLQEVDHAYTGYGGSLDWDIDPDILYGRASKCVLH